MTTLLSKMCSSQSGGLCGKVADKSGSLWERTSWDSGLPRLVVAILSLLSVWNLCSAEPDCCIELFISPFPLHTPNKKTPHTNSGIQKLLFLTFLTYWVPNHTGIFQDVLVLLFLSIIPSCVEHNEDDSKI